MTDAFLNAIRNVIYGDTETMPSHIGIGTGSTAVVASDTTLETEVYPYGSSRASISSKSKSATKEIVIQLSLLPAQANGNALKEVGGFNAAIDGTMTNRFVHNAIDKTSSFELIYHITITLSDV